MANLSPKIFYYLLILIFCSLSIIAVGFIFTIVIQIEDPVLVLFIVGFAILPLIFITYWSCKKLIKESKEL